MGNDENVEPGEVRDEPSIAGTLGNVTKAVANPPSTSEEPATDDEAKGADE